MIGLPVDRGQFILVAVSSAPHPPPIHCQEADLNRSPRSVGCIPWLQVLGVEAAVQGTAGPSLGGLRGGRPNKPASRLLILIHYPRPHQVTWPLPASNTSPPIAPHPSLTSSGLAFCSCTPSPSSNCLRTCALVLPSPHLMPSFPRCPLGVFPHLLQGSTYVSSPLITSPLITMFGLTFKFPCVVFLSSIFPYLNAHVGGQGACLSCSVLFSFLKGPHMHRSTLIISLGSQHTPIIGLGRALFDYLFAYFIYFK